MSRKIKFDFLYKDGDRFFHKKYYLKQLIDKPLCQLSDLHDQFELVAKRQYIGLSDRNGVEIYEGDIVETMTCKKMVIGWSDRKASFVIERNGWAFRHFFGEAMQSEECEVIGNIHQSPELLTEQPKGNEDD